MFGGYVALTIIGIALLIIIPIAHQTIEYHQRRQEEKLLNLALKEKEARMFNYWGRDLGNPDLKTQADDRSTNPGRKKLLWTSSSSSITRLSASWLPSKL